MSESDISIDECVDIALHHIRETRGTGRSFDLSRIRSAIHEELSVLLTEEHDQDIIEALHSRDDVWCDSLTGGIWRFATIRRL